MNTSHYKTGFYVSLATAVITLITFAVAVGTPPLSGPFCAGNCFEYPYTDIAGRFPRDYYWMYGAIVLSLAYLTMMVVVHQTTAPEKRLYSQLSLQLASMASLVLIVDYFVQLSVIQASLVAGETEGIALLTQFNPHGIFIVLEEIGFILMIVSFVALAPALHQHKALQWTVIIGFILSLVALVLVSIQYGIEREYRFEVMVISITWIEVIVVSVMLAVKFRKGRKIS
jgi:hypothetical protein